MRSAINTSALAALVLLAVTLLPGVANARAAAPTPGAASSVGPESDYPVVVGEPFTVDGKTYVPTDTMNYDAVGYAELGQGGDAVSGTHRTLPLPSYVEVTSLGSGKTILVRMTQRGPMAGPNLVALSAGAWAQLRLAEGAKAPVRVRRVNPPESERAMLRLGQHAPDRMETPPGLLNVLKRKLGDSSVAVLSETARGAAASGMVAPAAVKPAPVAASALPPKPAELHPSTKPKPDKSRAPAPAAPPLVVKPAPAAPKAGLAAPRAGLAVQIGAFGSENRAKAAASKVGAQVSHKGKIWRVRLGPFIDQASADRASAKAHAAGYRDARVVREP